MDGVVVRSPTIGRQLCGVYCGQPIPENLGDGEGAISGGAFDFSALAPAGSAARCRSPCAIHLSCGATPGSIRNGFGTASCPASGADSFEGYFLAPRMTRAARACANRFRSCQNCCRPTSPAASRRPTNGEGTRQGQNQGTRARKMPPTSRRSYSAAKVSFGWRLSWLREHSGLRRFRRNISSTRPCFASMKSRGSSSNSV
jgi:hypothetical protein